MADKYEGLQSLVGRTLKGKDGEVATDTIDAQVVGLYFSAHWCPPCRGFTPVLAEKYKKMKGNNQSIEIIFVSSDRKEEEFDEYFGTMPWLALPFSDRATKDALSSKYGIRGIPTLVIVNRETGALVTKEGRADVGNIENDVPAKWKA